MSTLHVYLRLMRFKLWLFVAANVLSVAFYTLPLIGGLIVREFLDALAGEEEAFLSIWTLVAIYVGVSLAAQVLSIGYRFVAEYHYGAVKALLQRNLLGGIVDSPPLRGGPSPGDMVNRFERDVDEVAQLIAGSRLGGFVISFAIALFVMASINALLALVAFVPIITVLLVNQVLRTPIRTYHVAMREATARVTGFLGELLDTVQAVKVASAERHAVRRFEELSEPRRKAAIKESALTITLGSMDNTTAMLATSVILIASAQLIRSGSLTVGDFALFVTYLGTWPASELPRHLGFLLAGFRQSVVSLGRLYALLPSASRGALVEHRDLHLSGELPEMPHSRKAEHHRMLSPNPPKDTDGRREESGRGGEGATGEIAWVPFGVGRSADGLHRRTGAPMAVCGSCDAGDGERIRSRELSRTGLARVCGDLRLSGGWVADGAVRPGVEWLAAGPRRG